MKKLVKLAAALAAFCGVMTGCQNNDEDHYTVGIVQFAEHGSLDNCREGFINGLADKGLVEGKNLKIEYQNAQADMGTVNQIVSSFVSSDLDLIAAIATPAAQAAYNAAQGTDIPVIYTAVTDPVAAQLADEDKQPVGQVTGTSDELPVESQLKRMRELLPDAKKLGIMYTTSEASSHSSVQRYEELAPKYGFELVVESVTQSSDIPLATDSLLKKVDVMTNILDNTVVNSLPLILDKANAKNIPVFGSEIEQVRSGCLGAEGIEYINLGKQTGHMAYDVLTGKSSAEEMPYQLITESSLYLNRQVAEQLGIQISDDIYSEAVEVFDQIGTHTER